MTATSPCGLLTRTAASSLRLLAVWLLSCLLWPGVFSASLSCPVVKSGRVVCLQAQLCAPGVPLQTPGCGPAARHVCCLKSGPDPAQRPPYRPEWESDQPALVPDPQPQWEPEPQPQWKPEPQPQWKPDPQPQWKPDPQPQWKPEPQQQWKPDPQPQWKPDPQPQWKPDVTQIPPWKTPPTETPPWRTKPTENPAWKPQPTSVPPWKTPPPWELQPTSVSPTPPIPQPRPSEPLLQCGRVQPQRQTTGGIDQRSLFKSGRRELQQLERNPTHVNPSQLRNRRRKLRPNRANRRRRLRRQLLGAVGGVDAERDLWPWAALLGDRSPDSGGGSGVRWICGAVLVSQRHLLTAAHCVSGLPPARLLVRLAEYDVTSVSDGATIDLAPAEIITHPRYVPKQNDIALLRLPEAVPLGPHIQPICLPPPNRDVNALTGSQVLLAGWGYTEFGGTTADVLQQVQLVVVPPADCEARYSRLAFFVTDFPGGFQGTKLCAAGENGAVRDACSGDSGGPLVQQQPDGSYQLVGVVAAGIGCGNPDFPGLYTRVSAYTDWVLRNIR